MIILINTSNLYIGGAVQVALSFIDELKRIETNHVFHILLSQTIKEQINKGDFPKNIFFYDIKKSPASLKTRMKIVKQIKNIEATIKPDVVFSVFGPTYWKPKTMHVMGFAEPWILNPKTIAFNQLDFYSKIKRKVLSIYKRFYLIHDADYYILETEDGRKKLMNVLKCNKKNVFVVNNCFSDIFNDRDLLKESNENYFKLPNKKNDEFRLVLISHSYPHKNIKIIKDVIKYLLNYNIKFILTIDDENYNKFFLGLDKYIINIGYIKQKSCPSIYSQCDALFLPSLLEVFSASYPEAMKMKKPILTSNFSFAKDVCQDAALYFDPLDPKDIANKIIELIEDPIKYNLLIEKADKRLNDFPTSKERALQYIKILEEVTKDV